MKRQTRDKATDEMKQQTRDEDTQETHKGPTEPSLDPGGCFRSDHQAGPGGWATATEGEGRLRSDDGWTHGRHRLFPQTIGHAPTRHAKEHVRRWPNDTERPVRGLVAGCQTGQTGGSSE